MSLPPRILASILVILGCGCASAGRLSLVAGPAADLASTEWAIGQGAEEANPLLKQREVRVPAKVAQAGVLLWIDSKLAERPGWRKALRIILLGGHLGLTVHNVQIGLEAKRAQPKTH